MKAHTSLILAVATASLALSTTGCSTAEGAETMTHEESTDEISPATAPVVERKMQKTLLLTGTIEPSEASDVASDGSGKVREALVERGDLVKKGQILAWLDATEANLAASEATASVAVARAEESHAALECKRAETLFRERAIARAEYDRMKATCEATASSSAAAGARAGRAAKEVSDSAIRAPFDGIVAERFVSVGEYVNPGTPIAQIVQRDPMRLRLTVPEAAALRLVEGDKVSFSVAPVTDATFSATVRFVGPVLDPKSRQLLVEALVDGSDQRLKPGMFATTRMTVGEQNVLAIPFAAVRGTTSTPRVFVIRDRRVEERVVLLGDRDGDHVGVVKGLSSGEIVAAQPDDAVRDGAQVQ